MRGLMEQTSKLPRLPLPSLLVLKNGLIVSLPHATVPGIRAVQSCILYLWLPRNRHTPPPCIGYSPWLELLPPEGVFVCLRSLSLARRRTASSSLSLSTPGDSVEAHSPPSFSSSPLRKGRKILHKPPFCVALCTSFGLPTPSGRRGRELSASLAIVVHAVSSTCFTR